MILVYQDEVHFQIQTTVTAGWYKKGSAPTVKSFPGRFKTSYSGFVIPETGELFTAKPEKFNYETTIDSIRSFLVAHPVPEGKRYALVMDNAPWHKKTMRLIEVEALPEYEDIRKCVAFIKLPPYSPDLNPIEQVWRITRRENTHNVFFSSLSLLESNVKPDRSDIDLLFGCLLEWGLPLSMPYTSEQIEGCTVHTYNEGDLIACFDENIPDSVIKAIAKRQPLRAVFRDSSFNGSPAKINVGEIFKMLAPDTRIKVI